jgi:hypothetical protein
LCPTDTKKEYIINAQQRTKLEIKKKIKIKTT